MIIKIKIRIRIITTITTIRIIIDHLSNQRVLLDFCLGPGNFGGDSSDTSWHLVILVVRCGRNCPISSQNPPVG